jgi:hypothetical protein
MKKAEGENRRQRQRRGIFVERKFNFHQAPAGMVF